MDEETSRNRKLLAENIILKGKVEQLIDVLSMCDPREDYGDGEGPVCQFCHATKKQRHLPGCLYVGLITKKSSKR